MPDSFNLRAFVRSIESDCIDVSPAAVAGEVIAQLPAKDRLAALTIAMPVFVRQVQSEERRSTHVTRPTGSGGTMSVRGQAIRDNWAAALRSVIHLDGSGSKRLRDCTYDDLQLAASFRDSQAQRNRAKAAEYRVLSELLVQHNVKTVGKLPAGVLAQALGAAA